MSKKIKDLIDIKKELEKILLSDKYLKVEIDFVNIEVNDDNTNQASQAQNKKEIEAYRKFKLKKEGVNNG